MAEGRGTEAPPILFQCRHASAVPVHWGGSGGHCLGFYRLESPLRRLTQREGYRHASSHLLVLSPLSQSLLLLLKGLKSRLHGQLSLHLCLLSLCPSPCCLLLSGLLLPQLVEAEAVEGSVASKVGEVHPVSEQAPEDSHLHTGTPEQGQSSEVRAGTYVRTYMHV